MNVKENIITALNNGIPEFTPYTFYSGMVTEYKKENEHLLFADHWKRLYDMGLGICHHVRLVKEVQHGVVDSVVTKKKGLDTFEIHTKDTPVGAIHQSFKNGWHHEYWIKTPEDYKVMMWIMKNTELMPCYEEFYRGEELIGNHGIVVILGSRTPAMTLNIDWLGTEQFCMDLALEVPELMGYMRSGRKSLSRKPKLLPKDQVNM